MSDRANVTGETPLDLSQWRGSIEAFKAWIDGQDHGAAKHWADRLKSNDPTLEEGAVAEAVA